MSKFVGHNNLCLIDLNSKTGRCDDKTNNIHATCKQQKVFVPEDSHRVKSGDESKTPSSTHNDVISSNIRDPTIDYNYFRASKTTQ